MKELAAWYQKKISSYDKAEWETLVEQLLVRGTYRRRVVDFSTHIPRSYLIDVDLVRGSSFPKAKPTLGVWRVVWLAFVRLLLLPGLFRWWRQQTSPTCARVLLALWLLQLINLLLYFLAPARLQVECDSVLVPLALMVALSVVHAHIVSTTALKLGGAGRGNTRRKLPSYFRRVNRECAGGSPGSAESGAPAARTKATVGGGAAGGSKPAKFRRRASLARAKSEDKLDDGLRKRKKTLEKSSMTKGTETGATPKIVPKAKDSDDEDYMDWKRPSVSPPTVTFTPPPEDNPNNENSFHFRANLLTRRHLETFNGREGREDARNHNVARNFADGDDGFESLNGNYSNGSDNEARAARIHAENIILNNFNIKPSAFAQCKLDEAALNDSALNDSVLDISQVSNTVLNDEPCESVPRASIGNTVLNDSVLDSPQANNTDLNDSVLDSTQASNTDLIDSVLDSPQVSNTVLNDSVLTRKSLASMRRMNRNLASTSGSFEGKLKKEKVDKHGEWGAEASESPGKSKRAGVRFRNSWVQEMIEHESSDGVPSSGRKVKGKEAVKLREYEYLQKSGNFQTSSSEGECETASAPSIGLPSHHTMSDWVGQTTNSEECSYSSQSEGSQSDAGYHCADSTWDPFSLLNPASDTVKCMMWEKGEMLKAELSAVDISWCVVARAERAMAADGGYLWAGVAMATAIALIAPAARLLQVAVQESEKVGEDSGNWLLQLPWLLVSHSGGSVGTLLCVAFGENPWVLTMNVISCFLRFALSGLCFFLLAVAERAYKQRFLYAKLFSHLTSARRARKSELPHFRLHTVRNIKTWLSARSYLRRRGPQRSVDVIVSAAFVVTLTLLACVAAQLLRESLTMESGWLLEVMVWCGCLGVYLLRLLTLGGGINRKYRGCLSAIITEQINLHLAIEQRPDSKDKLTVANNVLKLAADLLKELDEPFTISGICANHYLYTITKVVILSALSGILSEMLGFKLKLDKIKIK